MTKTQCIGQLAHRYGGIRYNNTADTVVAGWKAYWHRSLVHKARRRGWWPKASLGLAYGDRTFLLFTYHDGLSHTVSICGIAFCWASSFPLSFLPCLVCTRYRSTIRAPSVIWGAVGGMYRMCVVSLIESVQFSYRSNGIILTHFHA